LRGFSPIFFVDVDRKTDVIGLNSLLAAHFAPQALHDDFDISPAGLRALLRVEWRTLFAL